MNNKNTLICIVCPKGCHLRVDKNEQGDIIVKGHHCNRGEAYGIQEVQHPVRMLPTTVLIEDGVHERLPVITDQPIDKHLILKAMAEIKQVKVKAPIHQGEVIISHILGTDINIVASRSMACKL